MTAMLTRRIDGVEPFTQWEEGVKSPASACGPASIAVITEYWSQRGWNTAGGMGRFGSKSEYLNYLYRYCGGTPWGMPAWKLMRGLRNCLRNGEAGQAAVRRLSGFGDYKAEIEAGRPVAVKFDKWSSFRWRGNYAFDYHWTVGVGYRESAEGGQWLIVQDNGTRIRGGGYRGSRECLIDYQANLPVLTLIGVKPDQA